MSLSSWHSLILLVVSVVIVATIVGFVVLILRLERPISVDPHSVPGALVAPVSGWYPDPNDSSLVRHFNGRVWTSSIQPRG
jgi:Protein of unknown function (DUF2510)